MREKLAWLLEHCGASKQLARLPRDARALQPLAAPRAALHRRRVAQDARRSHGLHVERHRDRGDDARPARATTTVSMAFSDLHYSHRVEEDLQADAERGLRPDLVQHLGRHGRDRPARLLLRPERRSSTRSTSRRCASIVERVISTWEDRVGVTLEQTFGPAEGRRLYMRYIRSESRSGMYRESTRPEDVPEDLRRLETIEAQLETHVRVDTAESATLTIYSPRPLGLTSTLRTLEHLALPVQRRAVDPADAARRPHHRARAPEDRRAADDHRGDGRRRGPPVRGAARAPGRPRHRRSAERR